MNSNHYDALVIGGGVADNTPSTDIGPFLMDRFQP